MKLSLFGLALVAAVVVAAPNEKENAAWENFKIIFKKEYRDLYEETVRKTIFVENFKQITAHNERFDQGLTTYTLGVNEFSDMSSEEFRKTMNGFKAEELGAVPKIVTEKFVPGSGSVPATFDWRSKGAVTPVKNQGQCGSCWSFSSTGSLEGQYFLKTGKLASISEQNLVDCSTANSGCGGGNMNLAFTYIHNNDGIDTESAYPYEAANRACRYKASANVTSSKGYATIASGNEAYLKAAVATRGPVAVAIDASNSDFQHYASGVYFHSGCKTNQLDHAVLAVGYNTESGQDYWLVKNSWGTSWGISGYIKMARNRSNACGIASMASFPLTY